ncbi:hypothetical protein [Rhodococcus sp. 24CO]|uniref:hypothetical protein n=1 Tax=Rhodococcus sp. 24CO TaxID=3117460 RepID=UPI003D338DE4
MSSEQVEALDAFEQAVTKMVAVAREVVPSSASAAERAAAVSHLLGLLSGGIDLLVQRADPRAPLLTPWMTETRKIFGDSPDAVYTTAPVDNAFRYRMKIRPGNCVYWSAVVYSKDPSGNIRIVASLNDVGLSPSTDGYHEIRLGGTETTVPGISWLPLEEGAFWIMIREYFVDDTHLTGELSIEVLEKQPTNRPPDLSVSLAVVGMDVADAGLK